MSKKLVRITTIPASMLVLLKGQPRYMRSKGFEVFTVSSDGDEVEALKAQEDVPHYIVPFTRVISPVQDIKCLFQLYRILKKIKPDIVHTHTPKAGLIGMWAAWLAGVPVRMHTIAGIAWIETTGVQRWILKQVEKLTALPATGVYPNSFKQLDFLKHEGIANKKFKVLGKGSSNGIDTQHFQRKEDIIKAAQQLREQENVSPDACIWIFVGRIVKDKGMNELLYAWKQIHQMYAQDRLWLLGSEERELDPLSDESYEIIASHESSIKMWGFQNDIRPHLAAAEVLVFPSYREGFPNVPMQAGAMECALILSDINGCNEIVEHGVSGLLVPSKNKEALLNAMKEYRGDEKLRIRLQKASRQRIAENYDRQYIWDLIYQEYQTQMNNK